MADQPIMPQADRLINPDGAKPEKYMSPSANGSTLKHYQNIAPTLSINDQTGSVFFSGSWQHPTPSLYPKASKHIAE